MRPSRAAALRAERVSDLRTFVPKAGQLFHRMGEAAVMRPRSLDPQWNLAGCLLARANPVVLDRLPCNDLLNQSPRASGDVTSSAGA